MAGSIAAGTATGIEEMAAAGVTGVTGEAGVATGNARIAAGSMVFGTVDGVIGAAAGATTLLIRVAC